MDFKPLLRGQTILNVLLYANYSSVVPIFIRGFVLAFLLTSGIFACGQHSDTLYKNRVIMISAGAALITGSSYLVLYQQWYSDYSHSRFHAFDDRDEWEGMDKAGHFLSSYYIGAMGYHSLRWSGIRHKKALLMGATWGSMFLLGIEIFDGYSSGWGFSVADVGANVLGSAWFIGQQALWGEQRIVPKFSFRTSPYATYRPELLGTNTGQQILKDYNGQTYWLSLNPASFMGKTSRFPKWVSVAFGYGAEGMLSARRATNRQYTDVNGLPFDRYPVFYLAPEIDLHRVKTKWKAVNGILKTVGWIKFPLPGLAFSKHGLKAIGLIY
jgi:uncharacterized protein YfiM (DUF2279 family)